MITIHQRNWKVSMAMTLSAYLLKIYFLEFCLTNISLTCTQFSWFRVCLLSSPYSSHPQICHYLKKCNVLFSLVINNSPMNRFPISNSTYVQISCVKYIPLLCWIWPTFKQKSSLFYQQSLGMIQTHVPIFLKSPYSLHDKIRTTVKLITYTVPQHCLSLFTIHCNSLFPYVQLTSVVELSVFFLLRVITWVRSNWVPM